MEKKVKRKWRKGPPPHIGWWNASVYRNGEMWRWWDGKTWSHAAGSFDTAKVAARAASTKTAEHRQKDIQWTDFYPENARVPRVAP